MTTAISLLVLILALPLGLAAAYLAVLALLSRRARPVAYAPPSLKFDIIVPAHDEERCVERTLVYLQAVEYPPELRHIHVVADNCGDRTAELARQAGAEVVERRSPDQPGKGHALAFAFERSLSEGWADALVVVDADTLVSPNLLLAMQERLRAGAKAVQADYSVLNQMDSWRTRLLTIAFAAFHRLRSSARERLGLSVGLHGNGMAFSQALIREIPHEAFSIVEDLEYGLRLGEAGYRVHYAGEASVWGEMAASGRDSRPQRRRWEGGRLSLARAHAARLLRRGVETNDRVLLDQAVDLLVPPITFLVAASAFETVLAAVLASLHLASSWVLAPLLATDLCLAIYVLRGWNLSEVGWSGLRDLAFGPLYVVWRLGLSLAAPSERPGEWVRTARKRRGT